MNVLKSIKKTVYNSCLYFTIAEFLILLVATTFNETTPANGGTAGMFLSLKSTALIFAACFIISALNFVWRLDYSGAVKVLIHFIGSLAAYSVVFIVIPRAYTDVAQIIVRIAVFAVLYLISAFIALIISNIKRNRQASASEYESQFSDLYNKK